MRERYGTEIVDDGAAWIRRDRGGDVQARLTWRDDGAVVEAVGHAGARVTIAAETTAHAVLGPAHRVDGGRGGPAWMSAVDWRAPTAIPAIDRPAALPPGCGAMLLDCLARRAVAAGVAALRYAGPYPSSALWHSLASSFTTDGREDDFVADAAARWGGGALPAIPIDFVPAPHERVGCGDGLAVVARTEVEAIIVDGCAFASGLGVRRLLASDDGWRAALVFGDRVWAEIAHVDRAATAARRAPARPAVGEPSGAALPAALVAALAEVLADALPAPLTVDALRDATVVWGDAGLQAASDDGERIVVHVGLWQHLAPRGLAAVAAGLAEALLPIARARAVAALAATAGRPPI